MYDHKSLNFLANSIPQTVTPAWNLSKVWTMSKDHELFTKIVKCKG